jgi:two-component system response regulator MtrA
VVKPFKPKELVARMRARLRRGEDAAPEMLTIGPPGNQITIDVPAHTVSRDGEEVKLTPLEFDLLVALARKPRQVFTREVLLEQVWGTGTRPTPGWSTCTSSGCAPRSSRIRSGRRSS